MAGSPAGPEPALRVVIEEGVHRSHALRRTHARGGATQQCIVAFGTTDFRDDLKRITVPTIIIHGDSDRIVPLSVSGQRSHEMIKGSRLEVLKGAPHGFAATHPKELNALMLAFLAS